jgi:hypothetical protein
MPEEGVLVPVQEGLRLRQQRIDVLRVVLAVDPVRDLEELGEIAAAANRLDRQAQGASSRWLLVG